jgi:hypothetical protein
MFNIVDGKINQENLRGSQRSSYSSWDEQSVSHKQLSHNFTPYELSVLPLLTRLLAQDHLTHFNDRLRKFVCFQEKKVYKKAIVFFFFSKQNCSYLFLT